MTKPNPMNLSGASRVLAAAAAFDKRTVGEADAVAWADALHHLEPADCIRAVGDHYARTNEYLMPHHIRVRVREIIRERQDKAAAERGLPTGPPASVETRAEVRARVAREVAAAKLARQPTEAATVNGASVAQPESRTA